MKLLICGLALMLCVFPSCLEAEEDLHIIEDIKIDLTKETPTIKISSNTAIDYLDYTLDEPSRIIIDPLGTVYCNLDEKIFSGKDGIKGVSLIRASGKMPANLNNTYYPLDFVVIELKKPHYYDIMREEKLVVKLGDEIPPPVVKEPERVFEKATVETEEVVGEEFFDEEKFPLVERYKIEAGDELEVSVWQQPDLLRKIVVRPDGFISYPLAGEVKVSGLTTDRAGRELAIRLSRMFRKPEVSVIVTGFGSKGVFVLGAVNKPGLYPYKAKMTVLSAVSSADSWQAHAYISSVLVVKRFFSDNTEVIRVNLWDVVKKGDVKKDIELHAGDIVYVPQSVIGNIGTFLDGLRVRFGTGAHYTIE